MAVDPSLFGPATLSISQAVGAFNTFLPSLAEVRKRDLSDTEFVGDVRMGEVAATALTIGIGAIVSNLTGSQVPTLVAALICAGMLFMYETALRSSRPLEGKAA